MILQARAWLHEPAGEGAVVAFCRSHRQPAAVVVAVVVVVEVDFYKRSGSWLSYSSGKLGSLPPASAVWSVSRLVGRSVGRLVVRSFAQQYHEQRQSLEVESALTNEYGDGCFIFGLWHALTRG